MKRDFIALMLSVMTIGGMSICSSENVVFANEIEELPKSEEENQGTPAEDNEVKTEENIENSKSEQWKNIPEEKELEDEGLEEAEKSSKIETETEKPDAAGTERVADEDRENRVCLQIPQKLDLMIDPFEINGKGQIYSENFIIKNAGTGAGILTLSNIVCKPGDESEVTVVTDNEGMHATYEKYVYAKIVFGNGDEIVLSQEGSEYEIRLLPGEELHFCYSGEVNENALQSWKEHDVTVGVIYSWDVEESLLENIAEQKEDDGSGEILENSEDKSTEDESEKKDGLNLVDELENSDKNSSEDKIDGDEKKTEDIEQ